LVITDWFFSDLAPITDMSEAVDLEDCIDASTPNFLGLFEECRLSITLAFFGDLGLPGSLVGKRERLGGLPPRLPSISPKLGFSVCA
jgi:hypothetical protein